MNQNKSVEELAKELRIVANMINMGEKIQWARETTLMDEAADMLEELRQTSQEREREMVEEILGAEFVDSWNLEAVYVSHIRAVAQRYNITLTPPTKTNEVLEKVAEDWNQQAEDLMNGTNPNKD